MSSFKIVPKPIERQCDRVVLSNVHVKLFKEAYVYVDMYAGQQLLQQTAVVLTEDEYKLWADDDKYILEVVMGKLGFALEPVTQEASMEEPTAAPTALDQGTSQTQ